MLILNAISRGKTMTHIRYASDVKLLQKSVTESICLRYDDALQQLANLIKSIERKIELKGKSRAAVYNVKEGFESYEINP
jgi:hypothetical protein